MTVPDLDVERRDLLKGAGGALVMGFSLGGAAESAAAAEGEAVPADLQSNPQLDSWLSINADGTVTVFSGKVPLGQGNATAFSQIAAEELDVDFSRTDLVAGDTERTPNEGYTAGSSSLEAGGTALRYAAAQAQGVILELAATRLGANAGDLTVEDGTINAPNGASITYWDLLGGRYLKRQAQPGVQPEPPNEYDTVGESVERIDIPDKVTGGKAYVQDMERPGMVHGRVVHPPSYGASLNSIDTESVASMPGVVEVVRDGRFLGVVAEKEHQAINAMEALDEAAEWSLPANFPDQDDLYDYLERGDADVSTVDKQGQGAAAIEGAAETYEATYKRPYTMHGSIGPSCAVAEIDGQGQLTVWTHSQGVFPLRESLSNLMNKPTEEIRCVHREGAGCYGHNGADDVAGEAALLSDAADGRPVRLQWMREDAHKWEPFGSAMLLKKRAGLDANGNIVGWSHDVHSYTHATRPPLEPLLPAWFLDSQNEEHSPTLNIGGYRDAVSDYSFEHSEVTNHFLENSPLRVSALRSLGSFGNTFANESFMSQLAHEAGRDPVDFRLDYIEDARTAAVLQRAANMAGWGDDDLGENRGRGVAVNRYENAKAYTALVVDVTVADDGTVSVDRAYAADDSGQIVNPDGLKNQIQGGVVQATSWTLKEDVDFTNTEVDEQDWQSYPILTFTEMPEVDVELIDRPGKPYLGSGETSQGVTPAAIANAVYDATGIRFHELPLTPERVKAGLSGE
ncbi:xanthine dehydrogenase family protein molybdopterin-binding subunit [Halocalculus aciditolerans]|uniref:Aldehyde dehydrogenase n=1 Tax=Halocalculus aciditolerans TaxID=1383812 RepID=A0A830F3L6_9EURY|nr:molybdopterin cofactor-binding domain-containing protein [Halocalculus aciditolerans]GGL51855.1 aldehyde dehydrogenase [Halocalculus aciditolerans]